jgi:hypothetical protein
LDGIIIMEALSSLGEHDGTTNGGTPNGMSAIKAAISETVSQY